SGLFDGADAAEVPVAENRLVYVHVARGSVEVNGAALGPGDAARLEDESVVRVSGGRQAEVLVFDLPH
ncbi:hypothetical protein ABTA75_19310, partial [Acinetobacter baumannii]